MCQFCITLALLKRISHRLFIFNDGLDYFHSKINRNMLKALEIDVYIVGKMSLLVSKYKYAKNIQ